MDYKATLIHQPTKGEKRTLRLMIAAGVSSLGFFLFNLLTNTHQDHGLLYVLLLITIFYYCLKYLHEWYHYFSISVPEKRTATHPYTVDILTTFCTGEPYDMLEQTLTAIQNITYPHTAWCCDETNDPVVIAMCKRLQVKHVTRNNRRHAKAGNINNALQFATGELCVILDPDHVPAPGLLDDIVPQFDDPEVGFVQIVQAYYNHYDNLVAKGAAQQTYQFYGPMMMSMHAYGTVQAIGANCTFRRAALDSIGGHAPGLAEDMNTAMHLHARGWRSVYLPVVLTRGLVPASLSAYYKQQLKWSRGTFELLVTTFPKYFMRFTWRQQLHYFTLPFHYLCGLIFLINMLIPVISLFTGAIPLHMDMVSFLLASLPFLAMTILIRHYVQKWVAEEGERGFHVIGGFLQIGTWWVHCAGLVYTLLRKKVPYIPTPKDDTEPTPWTLHIPNMLVVIISVSAIVYGLWYDYNPFSIFMAGLALLNILFMLFILYASINRKKPVSHTIGRKIKRRLWFFRHWLYAGLRRYALVLSVIVMAVSVFAYRQQQQLPTLLPDLMPGHQVFYKGSNDNIGGIPIIDLNTANDDSILALARQQHTPVFVRMAVTANWKHVHDLFDQAGADQVIWVWNARAADSLPGKEYVDWISVDVPTDNAKTFDSIYRPFHQTGIPVMVTLPKNSREVLSLIDTAFNEIRAVITPDNQLAGSSPVKTPLPLAPAVAAKKIMRYLPDSIRGVVYDKGYHWFRNRHALLRQEVENDLAAMKRLGINTLVRSVPGIYDRTLFKQNINIIPRLWMSTRPEYVTDPVMMEKEKQRLLDVVRKYRHEKNIIAWNLGNDVLYTLNSRYYKPDYFYYRNNYIKWLSDFCRQIKKIDPMRPVTMDIFWNKGGKSRIAFLEKYLPEVDFFNLTADSSNVPLLEQLPANALWGNVPTTLWKHLGSRRRLILPAWQDIANADFVALRGVLDLEGRQKPGYDTVNYYWGKKNVGQNLLPDIKILKPAKITYEKKPLVYHALVKDGAGWTFAGDEWRFEWYLIRTDHYGTTLYMKKVGEGASLSLEVPVDPEHYRLYLEVVLGNKVKEATSTLNIPLD